MGLAYRYGALVWSIVRGSRQSGPRVVTNQVQRSGCRLMTLLF